MRTLSIFVIIVRTHHIEATVYEWCKLLLIFILQQGITDEQETGGGIT